MSDEHSPGPTPRRAPFLAASAVVTLALVLLAAHFLRDGNLAAVVILLAVIPLLGLQRRWVPRLFQVILGLGALEWLRTVLALRGARAAMGQPYGRMLVILGAVTLFTTIAAAVFEADPIRRWYRRKGE